MLYLYTQSEKETIKEYGCNFKSLWETVEAFGGLPGIHKGLVDRILKQTGKVAKAGQPTADEKKAAKEEASEAVKVALLISGANRHKHGRLKDKLANNYLLSTD